MSAMLMIAPRSSRKATDSGIRVFFIHMHWISGCSNTNRIPLYAPSDSRCIRPRARVAKSAATSARIRCMPALSWTLGSGCASALAAANHREIKKAGSNPCLFALRKRLFLVFHLLLASALLLLHLLLAVLLVHLLLHLFLLFHLRDRGHAYCREHRSDKHRQQLLHCHPL